MYRWLIGLFVSGVLMFAPALLFAQTSSLPSDLPTFIRQLEQQIKLLQAQVLELQTKLESTKQELQEVKAELKFTRALQRGAAGDDVRELQGFLKQFPDLYPEGLVTGYFGPRTEDAIRRFQERYGIETVGVVGPQTRAKLNELFTGGAGASGVIPPGLTIAPGLGGRFSTSTALGTTTSSFVTSTLPLATTTISATTSVTSAPNIVATSTSSVTAAATISTATTPAAGGGGTTGSQTATSTTTTTTTTATTTTTSTSATAQSTSTPISHSCGTAIYVPRDTPSIQTALNSACAGDTVFVSAGTYSENIVVPKAALALKGASGTAPETVIIDGGGRANVVYVDKVPSFTIEGITLRNAGQTGSLPGGAGIHFNPGYGKTASFTARNLIVRDNSFGVALWNMDSGSITLERSLIVNNIYNGVWGDNIRTSQFFITNNTIVNNGTNGYHDWAGGGSRTLKNNIIANNVWYGINPHLYSPRTILYNDVWNNSRGNYYEGYNGPPTLFTPSPGTGELSIDPKFVSASDFHLQASSPAINAGDPTTYDPDGSRADMGAYPFTGVATTTAPADTTPPVISGIQSTTTLTTATVLWTTDESSDSQVEYGPSASYGSQTSLIPSLVTNHAVFIDNLASSTVYNYRVKSKDAAGNLAISGNQSFTTLAPTSTAASVTLTGACYLKDLTYAVDKPGVDTIGELQSACSGVDYKSLLSRACVNDSNFYGTEGVASRDASGTVISTACGQFGCGLRECSQLATYDNAVTAGACYLHTSANPRYIAYQDPDSGSGYAKKNIDGTNDDYTVGTNCTPSVYDALQDILCATTPTAKDAVEEVGTFDSKGSVVYVRGAVNQRLHSCPSAYAPPDSVSAIASVLNTLSQILTQLLQSLQQLLR